MNRKFIYAGAAVAALVLPMALTALPASSQEAVPNVTRPDGRPNMQPRGGDQLAQQRDNRGPQLRQRGPNVPQPRGPQANMGPRGQMQMPQRPAVNPLEQFDTNKDGATTQAEIDEMRGARLRQFDANNDGKLSIDEYAALWLDAYRRQMVDQFQGHDDNGDGGVTIEEFNEDFANLVRRADRNGDGKVDATDVARPQVTAPGAPTPTTAPARPQPGNPRAI